MKYRLCILSLSILLFSCKKDFLELSPISSVNVDNFYKTAKDMQVAVNGAYGYLISSGEYRYGYWNVAEVRSDNTFTFEVPGNNPEMDLDQFIAPASNSILSSVWNDSYRGILACNVVMERISGINMDEGLKTRYVGEVKFLRALTYFNLVRTFGDVPLVLTETKSVQEGYTRGRVPVADIYNQIIKDLTEAEAVLPVDYAASETGRATKGAAKGLLGKVYLTKKDYASAEIKLKEVIDLGKYRLVTNYASLWGPANDNNAESVFEVQFKKGGTGTGSNFNNQFAPRNSGELVTQLGFAHGRNLPTADMSKAYETGDLRKNISMAEGYNNAGGTFVADRYVLKYRDKPYADGDNDNNWPVIRYADIMLMYAEAINEKNNGPTQAAFTMANEVRKRAGLAALPATLNYNSFALAIERERQVELAFEGHRWYDLVRTGRAVAVMNQHFKNIGRSTVVQAYHVLYPIPQTEIDVNPSVMKQNAGY